MTGVLKVLTAPGVWTKTAGGAGPAGPAGPGATSSYVHNQAAPASTWTITHNLGYYPNVTVIDSAGDVAVGNQSYPSANQVILTFSAAFSGTAYLS